MTDELRVTGIMSKGYGTIPKLVMQDTDLSIEAKAIYAYFASYAGAGETAFPGVKKTTYDLNIGKDRYYKHRKQLEEKGYISVERVRSNGDFERNIYTLHHEVAFPQNTDTRNGDTQNTDTQNKDTNNNSTNNNSINNNSTGSSSTETTIREISQFYQENFGVLNPYTAEDLNWWVKDIGGELVLEALKKALEHGKTYSYAKGIMKNWVNKNIKTLDDVKAQDVAHKNNKQNSFKTVSDDTVDENFKETEEEELDVTFDDLMKGDQD